MTGKRKFYSEDFEQFWRAYETPIGASKQKAYEAYKKDANLPSLPLLLMCVEAYKQHLKDTTTKTFTPSKCHAVTWLNQARYEGFLDRAEKALAENARISATHNASVAASAKSWPSDVLIALRLDEPVLKAWILPCTLLPGSPAKIITPTLMHANWLRGKLLHKIERALGEDVTITHAN